LAHDGLCETKNRQTYRPQPDSSPDAEGVIEAVYPHKRKPILGGLLGIVPYLLLKGKEITRPN